MYKITKVQLSRSKQVKGVNSLINKVHCKNELHWILKITESKQFHNCSITAVIAVTFVINMNTYSNTSVASQSVWSCKN